MSNAPPPKNLHGASTARRLPPTHSDRPISEVTAGHRYRVRDKDWVRVWAQDLSYAEAEHVLSDVTGSQRSRTARIEDMTVGPTPQMTPAERTETGEEVYVVDAGTPKAPAPRAPKPTPRPIPVRQATATFGHAANDPQLASLQAGARNAAQVAAIAAQKRRDDLEQADALRAKAAQIEAMLEGEDALDEEQIQGILDEVGVLPSDDEIAAAHANGVNDPTDSDAPVV